MEKTLKYYKRLPYTLYTQPMRDSDGTRYWVAEYFELRGCKTEGSTEAEAIANVQELFDEYITLRLNNNIEIPEPASLPSYVEEVIIQEPQKTIPQRSTVSIATEGVVIFEPIPERILTTQAESTQDTVDETERINQKMSMAAA